MINLPIQIKNETPVMSSVDLAIMCAGDKKDSHSNFMKKAKEVLGGGVVNFYDSYQSKQGKVLDCLMLPEREACLMAMSYSYELQAKVYDAWQSLRSGNAKVAIEVTNTKRVANLMAELSNLGRDDLIDNVFDRYVSGEKPAALSEHLKPEKYDLDEIARQYIEVIIPKYPQANKTALIEALRFELTCKSSRDTVRRVFNEHPRLTNYHRAGIK